MADTAGKEDWVLEMSTYDGLTTSEQPTPVLRWNGMVLEQQWQIITYQFGTPWKMRDEWRTVPQKE